MLLLSQSLHHTCCWLPVVVSVHSFFFFLSLPLCYVRVYFCRCALWLCTFGFAIAVPELFHSHSRSLCSAFRLHSATLAGSFNHGRWIFRWPSSNQCKSTFRRNRRRALPQQNTLSTEYCLLLRSFQARSMCACVRVCVCVFVFVCLRKTCAHLTQQYMIPSVQWPVQV